jgi:hypothetical protein
VVFICGASGTVLQAVRLPARLPRNHSCTMQLMAGVPGNGQERG